jgi:3-dehydroquinate synthase
MKLTVNLGPRSYPVILDHGIAASFPARLKKLFPGSSFALVTNTTLMPLYIKLLTRWQKELGFKVHVMPDGEQYKTIATWSSVLDALLEAKLERSSVVIAFGGGVVGDVAGFAASAFLRGVPCVQVPTTLLAMVDSSVGGKTGVDHACGKNLIGAFHQPGLVFIDTDFLKTLPVREYLAGYAELFKYAFIGSRQMFDFVGKNHVTIIRHDPDALLAAIKRSIAIKAGVVEKDEHETTGARAMLNFGHTFAHALEKYYGFENLLHGEAVWWGMHCACELGKILKTIPAKDQPLYDKITGLMPKPRLPGVPAAADLYKSMFFDKKVSGGKIRFVVPAAPGTSVIRKDISPDAIRKVLATVLFK